MTRLLELVCVDCGGTAEMNRTAANRVGWTLWQGGGRCPACCAVLAAAQPPTPPVARELVFVRCTECNEVFEAPNEFEDGWRPTFHWVKTRDVRPIPLCPGWLRAGVVVQERA